MALCQQMNEHTHTHTQINIHSNTHTLYAYSTPVFLPQSFFFLLPSSISMTAGW